MQVKEVTITNEKILIEINKLNENFEKNLEKSKMFKKAILKCSPLNKETLI